MNHLTSYVQVLKLIFTLSDNSSYTRSQISDIFYSSIGWIDIINNEYDYPRLLSLKVDIDEKIRTTCFNWMNLISASIGSECKVIREGLVRGKR